MKNLLNLPGRLSGDIRFWILFFLVFRLYGITQPPLEVAHNWRQTTVTMTARNFYERSPDVLYPQIDFAGEKSGITGMEFPVLNYLIYLMSLLGGYTHWYGRLINLLVSSAGVLYFFKIIKHFSGERTAYYSSLILLVSIWFTYSRKIMPDTFSVSIVLAGLWYGVKYVERQGALIYLLISAVLISIGVLSKLPSGILLAPVPLLYLRNNHNRHRTVFLWCAFTIAMIPVLVWYFYWVPYLVERFGFWHFFMGKSVVEALAELRIFWLDGLEKFYDDALKYSGFFVFVTGLAMAFIRRNRFLITVFCFTLAAFLVVILKAGFTFTHHSYYIIPFVPVMALLAGFALSEIKNTKWVFVLLVIIAVENVSGRIHDFRIKPAYALIENLESDLDKVSSANELVLINSGDYPTPMYFAHRKGWISDNNHISNAEFIDSLYSLGLKKVIILKQCFGENLELELPKVFTSEAYDIYIVTDVKVENAP